jgi:ATPase subunit of ABC transporter with duplicated ATPase domains
LEKLQDEEKVEKPFLRKQTKIRFPERGRSGKSVVMVKNLEFGYGEDKVSIRFQFTPFITQSRESTMLHIVAPGVVLSSVQFLMW